jgi:hypothetical protein
MRVARHARGRRVAYRSQFLAVHDRGYAGQVKIKARLIGDHNREEWLSIFVIKNNDCNFRLCIHVQNEANFFSFVQWLEKRAEITRPTYSGGIDLPSLILRTTASLRRLPSLAAVVRGARSATSRGAETPFTAFLILLLEPQTNSA